MRIVLSLGVLLLSGAAMAQTQQSAPQVVTGGVGEASQQAIQQLQDQYNLKLVFTGEGGMYLGDVAVNIRDRNGREVLGGVSDGPIMLTNLAPGNYTVEAQTESVTQRQNVRVGEDLKTYHMRFPIQDNTPRMTMTD